MISRVIPLTIVSYSRRPATVAAALLPSPACIGISLSISSASEGKSTPSRAASDWMLRAT